MRFPTHTQLVEHWLVSKFNGVPCIVFFDPLGNGDRISLFKDRFGITSETQLSELMNSDVFILPHENPDSIVNNLEEDEWGFVMSWSGARFTTENT